MKGFDWDAFNERGRTLYSKLKKLLHGKYKLEYLQSYEEIQARKKLNTRIGMKTKRLSPKELNIIKKLYTESIPENFSGALPLASYDVNDTTEAIVSKKRRDSDSCILQDVFRFRNKNIYIYSVTHKTGEDDER